MSYELYQTTQLKVCLNIKITLDVVGPVKAMSPGPLHKGAPFYGLQNTAIITG